jgi:hypothetical protein
MDEIDPYQSERWRTHQPPKIVMVDPYDGDEEVTHRIADGGGPQGQRSENAACSGALSSSTMMVTITAKTASEYAANRSAVSFFSGIDPERAKLTNVRWTGTLPYAAMENFDRMKAAMWCYRQLSADHSEGAKLEAADLERDIGFYMGWMGHYTADGAQPLHDTIHHNGWQGSNPNHYTRDPHIHGRFESSFVDLIQLTDADLKPRVGPAKVLNDPFGAVIRHLDDAATHVKQVYRLDKQAALNDAKNAEAAELVKA